MQKYDVIVVGGGPAGCSAAITCATLGLEVLLIEKRKKGERKPCGGVLPHVTAEIIEDIFGSEIPQRVMNSPSEIGLYYVPPSGRANGGAVANYTVYNITRELFDEWLLEQVGDAGVEILTETRVRQIKSGSSSIVNATRKDESISYQCDHLIGADGVHSTVRQSLGLEAKANYAVVGQQLWHGRSRTDIGDYFYGFFRGDISIAYSYAIPKGNDVLIGTGTPSRWQPHVFHALDRFQMWLKEEFGFDGLTLKRKETWSIPFGCFIPGEGKTLFVGDAAGLCNPLSGEGIRLGIESGEAAGGAIRRAINGEQLISTYVRDIAGISQMVSELHDFVLSVDDKDREEFIANELSRGRL